MPKIKYSNNYKQGWGSDNVFIKTMVNEYLSEI